MIVKLPLKNTAKSLLLDKEVYEKLKSQEDLAKLKVLENLRIGSAGYPVFQKRSKIKDGFRVETIHIHKYIAQLCIERPKAKRNKTIRFVNGDVLDCRVENLEWGTIKKL
jgi:hypothetical protein